MESRAALRINQEWCFANVLLYASWAADVVLSVGWSLSSLDMNRIMNSKINMYVYVIMMQVTQKEHLDGYAITESAV